MQIIGALREVVSQLDAADRIHDHDPWRVIARQESEIGRLTGLLSDHFRGTHSDLVQRLSVCTSLHLVWGSLQDEIEKTVLE